VGLKLGDRIAEELLRGEEGMPHYVGESRLAGHSDKVYITVVVQRHASFDEGVNLAVDRSVISRKLR